MIYPLQKNPFPGRGLIFALLALFLLGCSQPTGDDGGGGPIVPDPVRDLAGVAGDRSVTLSWTDPAGGFDHIEITWASGQDLGGPQNADPGDNAAAITGLKNGASYLFTVLAVDGAGGKSAGEYISLSPEVPATGEVSGLKARTDRGAGKVTLSWTDPVDSFDHIEITWIDGEGAPVGPMSVNGGVETETIGSLSANERYAFTVKAVQSDNSKSAGRAISLALTPLHNWTKASFSLPAVTFMSVDWCHDRFIATGRDRDDPWKARLVQSVDGITWTEPGAYPKGTVGYGNNLPGYATAAWGGPSEQEKYIVAGQAGVIYSTDGASWTSAPATSASPFTMAWGSNRFVVGGTLGIMAFSSNGTTWSSIGAGPAGTTFGSTSEIYRIVWCNNKFIASGEYGAMAWSANGVTWNAVTPSVFAPNNVFALAGGGGVYLAAGSGGKMARSSNGETWTLLPFDPDLWGTSNGVFRSLAWGGPSGKEVFIVGGGRGAIGYSSDGGDTWVRSGASDLTDGIIQNIAWNGTRFAAVTYAGDILYSDEL